MSQTKILSQFNRYLKIIIHHIMVINLFIRIKFLVINQIAAIIKIRMVNHRVSCRLEK